MKFMIGLLVAMAATVSSAQQFERQTAEAEKGPSEAVLLKVRGLKHDVKLADIGKADVTKEALAFKQAHGEPVRESWCLHVEQGDRELAGADLEDIHKATGYPLEVCRDIRAMHRAALKAAAGKGSWPSGCYSLYPKHHSVTYFVERSTFPDHYKRDVTDSEYQGLVDAKVWGVRSIEEAKAKFVYKKPEKARASGRELGDRLNKLDLDLWLMEEANRRAGCAWTEVFTGPNGEHNVHIVSRPIPGATIGYAYFNDGTCGDHVLMVIDSTYRPGLHSLANLLTHEAGHNNNCQHTFSGQNVHHGIMSYAPTTPFQGFSPGGEPYRNPKDPAWKQLTVFFDPIPVPLPNGPEPDPDPTPSTVVRLKIGMTKTEVIDGKTLVWKLQSIDGGDPTVPYRKRVADALAEVGQYGSRELHAGYLVELLQSAATGVTAKKWTIKESKTLVRQVFGLITRGHTEKWNPVLDIVDAARQQDDLTTAAEVISEGKVIPSRLRNILLIVVTFLPDGDLKRWIEMLLDIFESQEPQKAKPPADKPAPAKRSGFGYYRPPARKSNWGWQRSIVDRKQSPGG